MMQDPMNAPAGPLLECDLVMKGGVTSGIVYPAAIAAIAGAYRLRSVGGTSAGAIGAAAAAAMEFGRRSGRNGASVAMLKGLAARLGAPSDGSPLLRHLFEPDADTAGLFALFMGLADASRRRGAVGMAGRLLVTPFLWAALVAALGTGVLLTLMPPPIGITAAIALLLVLLLGTIVLTLGFAAWSLSHTLGPGLTAAASSGFGFCSGMARHRTRGGEELPSLTGWLHEQIQALAGLDPAEPLCFGDLWAAGYRAAELDRSHALDAARAAARREDDLEPPPLNTIARDVELVLVASDINRAQSVQLPFMRREDRLYARRSDLRALFPPDIVAWMEAHAGTSDLDGIALGKVPEGDLFRLPPAQDLPILFGVRMSLSFPFLFRAVRLYLVRRRAGGVEELAEIWLADGGITSNFPIHLFDGPIPARPTFCLNLLYHDDELEPDERRISNTEGDGTRDGEDDGLSMDVAAPPEELVYMLRSNGGRVSAYTRFTDGGPIGRLVRFGGRIVTTARQWGDNQLIDVPGYRDRIVHIRMRRDEGGFNFDMDAARIADLESRGARAGTVIAGRFLPDAQDDPLHPGERLVLNWANHRMARFRSFLAGLEVTASRFGATWASDLARAELPRADPGHVAPSLEQMIDARPGQMGGLAQPTGYPFRNDEQAELAQDMVRALTDLAARGAGNPRIGVDFVHGRSTSPRPKSGLKLRPPIDTDPQAEQPVR